MDTSERSQVRPTILTIAGSDSCGGAGIQADLKSIAANGGYGASVVTAVTAQNTRGVTGVEEISPGMIEAQIDAVFDDLEIAAVKTGMLASARTLEVVAARLRARRPRWIVCDPVMVSRSGARLLAEDALDALVRELLPLADLVTPNADETAVLAGTRPRNRDEAVEAGGRIVARGARAVLVKGGHLDDDPATDVLVTVEGSRVFTSTWIDTPHTHGTGCTYSAAIATHLGRGLDLESAIEVSKRFLTCAIRGGLAIGRGAGPTDPFFFLGDDGDPPWIERSRAAEAREP
jgi:hydroxymethylpyrimidine/phosphomethylpyrimidine kinase